MTARNEPPILRVTLDDLYGEEAADWMRLTPRERWVETTRLAAWHHALGGTNDPDPSSPFYDADVRRARPVDGGPGVRVRGHAVHFSVPDESRPPLRVDIMSRMRGVADFSALWARRTTLALPDVASGAEVLVDVMALDDLVTAKKTQRDKDWPMLRRLVDASYAAARDGDTTWRRCARGVGGGAVGGDGGGPCVLGAIASRARGTSARRSAPLAARAHATTSSILVGIELVVGAMTTMRGRRVCSRAMVRRGGDLRSAGVGWRLGCLHSRIFPILA